MTAEKIDLTHPDPAKEGARVDKATYEAYRDAVLKAVPATEEGIAFKDLPAAVTELVDAAVLERAPVGWWTTTTKLDLEGRGLIERIPGKSPQRLRRLS
ncbi:DUF6958 family protein [Streptomyces parvulus]|uniref:DUF6958 family protein n=1 Tax=Streptomyces parvulus TaxID=146923 RepID=UPI0037893ED4